MAIEQVYAETSAPITLRSGEQIRDLLSDWWEFPAPGVADVRRWLKDSSSPGEPSRSATYVGGMVQVRPHSSASGRPPLVVSP
ncbi:hypothetical protein HD597_000001, partial [Nonomuraea thailandensis]